MKYRYCAATEKGLHAHNKDSVFVNGKTLYHGFKSGTADDGFYAVICDGVGGEIGGEIASRLATESFRRIIPEQTNVLTINKHLYGLNENICRMQKAIPEVKNMSTTVAGLLMNEDYYTVFNVGDTRVYQYSNGNLVKLSKDHTLAQFRYDWNEIDSVSEASSEEKSMLTRFIGGNELISKPYVRCGRTNGYGDIVIICSDGVYKTVNENIIKKVLELDIELDKKEQAILLHAKKNGSDDASLILIERIA